ARGFSLRAEPSPNSMDAAINSLRCIRLQGQHFYVSGCKVNVLNFKIFHLTNFHFRTIMVAYRRNTMTEVEKISPEGLEVAKAYLENKQDILATARAMQLPIE